jgi:hypothetical protein
MEEYTTTKQQSYDLYYDEKKNTLQNNPFRLLNILKFDKDLVIYGIVINGTDISGTVQPFLFRLKVSKEAEEFIKSFNIPVSEVVRYINLLFSGIGTVKEVSVDLSVDYDEYDEEEKPWKNLKITFCIQDIPINEKIEIINKLSRDFYAVFPDLPTYFVINCSNHD